MSRRRLTARLAEESGVALIMALGFLVVLTIVILAMLQYTASASRTSEFGQASQTAAALAEAGANSALSVLANAADPTQATTLPVQGSPTVDNSYAAGTVSWWGSYNSGTSTWTVTGQGVVANPTGGGATNITRTVSVQAKVSPGTATTANNQAWANIFSYNPGGCTTISNSVQIMEPLYVVGNLCLNNSSQILASASPVTITGSIQTTSSSSVGTNGAPIPVLHVGGGCRYGASGSYVTPCTSTEHVYATSQDTTAPAVSKPPLNLAYWYANAMPGPSHNCTSGSFPGGFDTNGAMDASLPDVNLFPNSSYDCQVVVNGTTVGRIAYDKAASTLTILGTIFFDGNIHMSGSQKVAYTGRGTIYASGTVNLQGSQQICAAVAPCNFATGNWNPETNLLVFVAGSSSTPDLVTGQSMQFQGGLYANTDYTQGSSCQIQGPIVANNISMSSSSQAKFTPYTTLAPGSPSTTSAPTVAVLPGSWSSN